MFEEFGYNQFLIERYLKLFGKDETKKLLESNERIPLKAIRINTLKTKVENCISHLEEKGFSFKKIKWCDYCFEVIEEPFSVGSTTEYLLGFFYIQDATSVLPSMVLNPSEKDLVLDMAAAPGGKTTHLSQIMNNKGVIIAIDINKEKMKALKSNIHRMGCENTILLRTDALKFDQLSFDKILIDAPCTAEGTIRKNPELKKRLKLEDFEKYANKQKQFIDVAYKLLKPKGIIVYSTCAISPEENEEVVEYALSKGMKLLDTGIKEGLPGLTFFFGKEHNKELVKCKRFYPHIHDTQGFFIAKLVKL